MKHDAYYYHTAGITICVTSDYPMSLNTFHPKFNIFRTDHPGDDLVTIHHHFSRPPQPDDLDDDIRFSDDQWQVYKVNSEWIYKYRPFYKGDPQHRAVGIFNADHSKVDMYIRDVGPEQYLNYGSGALTFFNTDQMLFSKLLCDRNGLIIHSNGFDIENAGILLTGHSGAGKSTLSSMLKKRGHPILCDDRMFIIKPGDQFIISGHWCHGSVPDVSNTTVPLRAVFILEQSKENRLERITQTNINVQLLIKSMVKSFFSPSDWQTTLLIIEKMARKIPFYKLKFDLSGKICDMIKTELKTI